LTYDVETEGATLQKELPFVVGVLGDFSGNPSTPAAALEGAQIYSDRPG